MNLRDFKKLVASIPDEHDLADVHLVIAQHFVADEEEYQRARASLDMTIEPMVHPALRVIDFTQTRVERRD